MASERSISELAALIESKTKILAEGTKGQPGGDFSFALAVPPPTVKLDPSLEAVRNEVIEVTDELKARLLGPFSYMGSLALPVVRAPYPALVQALTPAFFITETHTYT